jgi:short-subunit dehydrogenase
MNWDLSGKAVLVTGAARGIGAETARRLAARGARLSLVGLEPGRLEALAAELGPGHVWFEADVTQQRTLDRAVAETVKALGGLDVVMANAGVSNNGTVAVNPPDAVARTLEVNLVGTARTVATALPHIIERKGYVLLVASAAALRPLPGMAAYCSSKVGVEYFGSSVRLEVKHKGVDVGVAFPSWIDTDLVRDQRKDLPSFNELLAELPYPFSAVTQVDVCADALVRAIARRQRRVFIPGSVAPFASLRWLFGGRLADWFLERRAAVQIPKVEQEVRALGRAFGSQSAALPAATAASKDAAA